MRTRVRVIGAERTARGLARMGTKSLDQSQTMAAEARRTQRAITGVPVDTGRLQASVKGGREANVDVRPDGYSIGSKVPYAAYVFGGTKYMRARPPRVPSDVGRSASRAVSADLTSAT